MFVLAHLSDPHLAPLPRPRLAELGGKRVIGFLNWRLRRRLEHQTHILQAVERDLAAQAPDHIAVTGDLVNIALPGEFEAARAFLERLGAPDRVSFVPGNHDAYVSAACGLGDRHWGQFMEETALPHGGRRFPYVRRRGRIALIGLSTAVPTPPFRAWGKLGPEQLEQLDSILAKLGPEGIFRTVLLHHAPVPFAKDRHKELIDADGFRTVLRERGAELVLHGHSHLRSLSWIDGPQGAIPVVGVPSASAIGHHDHPAGYNLYRIDGEDDAWRCEMIARGFTAGSEEIAELDRRLLRPPQ